MHKHTHVKTFVFSQETVVLKPKDLREDNNTRTNEFNRHQQRPKKVGAK